MSSEPAQPAGPDLRQGIPFSDLPDGGMLAGHVGGEPALLARRGEEIFAIGAICTHYSGPLTDGLMVGETVRCPWHHACFSLRTGLAVRAPALSPVSCWRVEQPGNRLCSEKLEIVRTAPVDLAEVAANRRHHRRRRGGQCRRRNAPERGLFRRHHNGERRREWPL